MLVILMYGADIANYVASYIRNYNYPTSWVTYIISYIIARVNNGEESIELPYTASKMIA